MTLTTRLTSAGGAYLVMSEQDAAAWPGAANMDVYDSVPFGADEGLVATLAGLNVIVLGIPDPLYCAPLPDGGLFATAIFADDEEARVTETIVNLPTEGWTTRGNFEVTGPLVAFDSAQPGAAAERSSLDIPAGRYDVLALCARPNDETELQLLRLRRATS